MNLVWEKSQAGAASGRTRLEKIEKLTESEIQQAHFSDEISPAQHHDPFVRKQLDVAFKDDPELIRGKAVQATLLPFLDPAVRQ